MISFICKPDSEAAVGTKARSSGKVLRLSVDERYINEKMS